MEPVFFSSPQAFRKWLEKSHAKVQELLVGFHKVHTGTPSLTWAQSVDEALCFGWIDGVRRSLGPEAYTIRFTPRKKTSIWSAVNVRRVGELTRLGLMQPAGLKAFAEKKENRSGVYSFEQKKPPELDAVSLKKFKAEKKAYAFFEAQAPSYKKPAIWWVVSAKRDETRLKRLDQLIADSAAGKKLRHLAWEKAR